MTKAALLLAILGLGACGATAEPAAKPPSPSAAVTPAPALAPALPLASEASSATPLASASPLEPPPLEIDYPFKGLDVLPDGCKEPSVVLTTAPKKMGWDYDWTWTRQAFLANPQFQLVDWPAKAAKAMEVRLDMYAIPDGFALVGVCHDGATCNKLAAMYKGTVPTCSPRLHCGPLPIEGTPRRSALIPASGQWLPQDSEVIASCARIGVCMKMKHEPFKGNPGVVCQSAPGKFRTACAKKATCDEVVACLR